jgi:hypothetical protein
MQNQHRLPLPLVLFLAATAAAQSPATSPADRALLEGSTFTHLPLGRADARMQTLHLDVPGGAVISGHAYRREAAGVYGQVQAFASDLEVTLSMSPNTPAQASATFAANVGGSPVTVLPRTALAFPGTQRPAQDPAPAFELVVPYATPFTVPPQGGTLCVDVTVFGNATSGGSNRNFNVYLDGHEFFANGSTEQPGYRYGTGCAPTGSSGTTYGALSLWHLGSTMELALALRNGVPEDGSGLTRAWVALGVQPATWIVPQLPQCTVYGSAELLLAMPGTLTSQGRYDGTQGNLPVLPPGYRLWCQSGSVHLGTGALSFGDGVTLVTPPPAPQPIPACRIASSSDRNSATGSVTTAVPVTLFF